MQRVPLPNDQWADVRPVADLTVRGRNLLARTAVVAQSALLPKSMKVMELQEAMAEAEAMSEEDPGLKAKVDELSAALAAIDFTEADLEAGQRQQEAGIVAFVMGWSFPFPCTMDTVGDMPADAFDTLQAVVGPLALEVTNTEKFSVDGAKDPQSPTEPSTD